MVDEATVDAYGESEQIGGFCAAIDEHLTVPFETAVLGTTVTVRRVDLTDPDEIVALGSHVSCADTVPLALWVATSHPDDYRVAVETAVAAGGDTDTMAAIVGATSWSHCR